FFSSRRRHTRFSRDWSSDVCSSDLSAPGANQSCHFWDGPNPLPVDMATYTSARSPWVNATMSSRPSPLKSPVSTVSPGRPKKSCHFTAVPTNRVPSDRATYTSLSSPSVNATMSSRPSPSKSVGEPAKYRPPDGGGGGGGAPQLSLTRYRW